MLLRSSAAKPSSLPCLDRHVTGSTSIFVGWRALQGRVAIGQPNLKLLTIGGALYGILRLCWADRLPRVRSFGPGEQVATSVLIRLSSWHVLQMVVIF